RRHTRSDRDWSSDVCSSDLELHELLDLLADRSLCLLLIGNDQVTTFGPGLRSEERRVGKECRSRWWPHHSKNKTRRTFAHPRVDQHDPDPPTAVIQQLHS